MSHNKTANKKGLTSEIDNDDSAKVFISLPIGDLWGFVYKRMAL